MAHHELVAIGCCLGHAVGAAHGARAHDILNNHLLTQKLGKARGKDAPKDIAGAPAGNEITMVTGRVGQSCACAGPTDCKLAANVPANSRRCHPIGIPQPG